MHIRQIKKSAATLALVAMIILAGFALGLADERSPRTSGYFFGLHLDPEKASALDGVNFQFGLLPNSGPSLVPLPKASHRLTAVRAPARLSARHPLLTAANVQKIALHLLDSVLLI